MLHLFALQRGTGVASRLNRASVSAGKWCNRVSGIKRHGSPLFTIRTVAQIHSQFSLIRSDKAPSLALHDVVTQRGMLDYAEWLAVPTHAASQWLRSHLAGVMEHLPSTPDSFSCSLSDHQHGVWMCYCPNTKRL